MSQRIWELDAARGFCILGMVVVHLIYDLVELYQMVAWQYPIVFTLIMDWGGVAFVLICGICVTLGRRHIKRGITVLLCGMVCTLVTGGLALLGFAHRDIVIRFGVLHCLGSCMILWAVFRKLPSWLMGFLAAGMIATGLYLRQVRFEQLYWLTPLGFQYPGFVSSDYFPLLPNLGFFLLGALLGRTVYRQKKTLLPNVDPNSPVPGFLRLCGKHSLWIYLLHQPVISGLLMVISAF